MSARCDLGFSVDLAAFLFAKSASVAVRAATPPAGDVIVSRFGAFDVEQTGGGELFCPSANRADVDTEPASHSPL
jgi:hypothetical protein